MVSGFVNLFVDYVYMDGVLDLGNRMIKVFFGINRMLCGNDIYCMILLYFIMFDIFFEDISDKGNK